jgi:hypothetical protein
MKKLGVILLLIAVAIAATVDPGEAGWKKRGWYKKTTGTECVMRKVSVVAGNGRVVIKTIRVCR